MTLRRHRHRDRYGLQILEQNPRVSTARFVFCAPGRRQNFWPGFYKAALLLEVDKGLRRQCDQFRKSPLAREGLRKRHQLASQSLIFVRSTDVEASQLGHLMFRIWIHGHATDDVSINL